MENGFRGNEVAAVRNVKKLFVGKKCLFKSGIIHSSITKSMTFPILEFSLLSTNNKNYRQRDNLTWRPISSSAYICIIAYNVNNRFFQNFLRYSNNLSNPDSKKKLLN